MRYTLSVQHEPAVHGMGLGPAVPTSVGLPGQPGGWPPFGRPIAWSGPAQPTSVSWSDQDGNGDDMAERVRAAVKSLGGRGQFVLTVVDEQAELEARRINGLWNSADRYINQAYDVNARMRMAAWLADNTCPAWRRERVQAVIAWMDRVWEAYYAAKANAEQQQLDLSHVGAPPYTFVQLLNE